MRPPRRRSGGRCADPASSSSSTPTRVAPRNGLPARRLDGRSRGRPGQRVRRRRGAHARGRPRGRRGADLDLPRDRRRPGLHRRGARDSGDEAEPPRAWSTSSSPPTIRSRPRPPRRSARSGPPAARSWSRRPTSPRTTPTTWTCATRRPPTPDGAARPRPRVAAGPRRHVERDRARPRAAAGRDGQRPDLTRRRGPPGGGQGARDARPDVDGRGRLRRATRSSRSPTRSRCASTPVCGRSPNRAARSAMPRRSTPWISAAERCS